MHNLRLKTIPKFHWIWYKWPLKLCCITSQFTYWKLMLPIRKSSLTWRNICIRNEVMQWMFNVKINFVKQGKRRYISPMVQIIVSIIGKQETSTPGNLIQKIEVYVSGRHPNWWTVLKKRENKRAKASQVYFLILIDESSFANYSDFPRCDNRHILQMVNKVQFWIKYDPQYSEVFWVVYNTATDRDRRMQGVYSARPTND